MKTRSFALTALLVAVFGFWPRDLDAAPVESSFSYQGRLNAEGAPAQGNYDVKCILYDAQLGGSQVGPILTNSVALGSDGLFSMHLDFGPVFDGKAYWLEICIRTNGSPTFYPLPRQALTPTPQALYAVKAGEAATASTAATAQSATTVAANAVNETGLQDGAVTAPKIGPGQVVKSLNGLTDAVSFTAGIGLSLDGTSFRVAEGGITTSLLAEGAVTTNKLSVLGATEGQILKYDGVHWKFGEDNDTHYLAGTGLSLGATTFSVNFSGSGSALTASHSDHTHSASDLGTGTLPDECLSGSYTGALQFTNPLNWFTGGFSGEGTGLTNLMTTNLVGTLSDAQLSPNVARLGANQTFSGMISFVPSSGVPFAVESSDTVDNLSADLLDGLDSAGFWKTSGNGGTTAGPHFLGTTDEQPLEFKVNNARAFRLEPTTNSPNVIGGWKGNVVSGIPGGFEQGPIMAVGATISGGGASDATIELSFSVPSVTISNGANIIYGSFSTISGGIGNQAGAEACTVGGGAANRILDETSGGGLPPTGGTISGGIGNSVINNVFRSGFYGVGQTISGGLSNRIHGSRFSTIAGGDFNSVTGEDTPAATISGGTGNRVRGSIGPWSTIGGGLNNTIEGSGNGTIGGGSNNRIVVSGGGTIGGGGGNVISDAHSSTIPGGSGNSINLGAHLSFAAGQGAQVNHRGCFLWADSSSVGSSEPSPLVPFASNSTNEFAARATGGVRFVTAVDTNGTPTAGVQVAAGGTGWSAISDRNLKENFEKVDGREVLEQVSAMLIQRWNMKSQAPSVRHIGPMAQDFHAAFGVGEDNRHINSVDADGVALAAIQGLHSLVKEQDAEIKALKATVAELKQLITSNRQ